MVISSPFQTFKYRLTCTFFTVCIYGTNWLACGGDFVWWLYIIEWRLNHMQIWLSVDWVLGWTFNTNEHVSDARLRNNVLVKNLSTNQLFCVHSYYNNSKQYWWIYVFLIILNDLKWNNKFYHMQHILWSALFTSNGSTHYHIHHKMDERKLTIIRGWFTN